MFCGLFQEWSLVTVSLPFPLTREKTSVGAPESIKHKAGIIWYNIQVVLYESAFFLLYLLVCIVEIPYIGGNIEYLPYSV